MQENGYSYSVLEADVRRIKEKYPFVGVDVIGKSLLGRNLYLIKLGSGKNEVFYNAAHHALEWITSAVLMKFARDFAAAFEKGESLNGHSIKEIWEKSAIYIVPMVNPDGVEMVLGADAIPGWQANARGVDLNHNYDAGWEIYKNMEKEIGISGPGPTRYAGEAPESEPETKAIADFTRSRNFRLVLAYHAQGEVIYWNFMNLNPPCGEHIGKVLASVSGYSLETASGPAAYSGYDDWFTKEFGKPGYTVEVGLGKNPIPVSQLDKIYADNLEMLLLAATI